MRKLRVGRSPNGWMDVASVRADSTLRKLIRRMLVR